MIEESESKKVNQRAFRFSESFPLEFLRFLAEIGVKFRTKWDTYDALLREEKQVQTSNMNCLICLIRLTFNISWGQELTLKTLLPHGILPDRLVIFRGCRPTFGQKCPAGAHVLPVLLGWWFWLLAFLSLPAGQVLDLPWHKTGWHFESSCLLEA